MPDRRMSLRTWIVVIITWGTFLAWVRAQGSLSYAWGVATHSPLAWGLCVLAGFAVARKLGPGIRRPGGRILTLLVLAAVLAVTVYLAWAHYRARFWFGTTFDQGFPYPDPWINAMNRWFDARHPVARGMLKLHSEYLRVAQVLGTVILSLAAVAGLLLGLIGNGRSADEGSQKRLSDRGAT